MEKLTAFERGQIVGALSTGASVVKTAELLNVPKDVVSQVMAAYSKHGQSALVELVKKKPQHRHKKPPPTQIACGDISIGTSPIQALEKALALEKQAAGDEDDDEDEDMDDEVKDLNIKTINEDEDDDEDEGSSEEQSESHKVEGEP
ncbi:uncharacterized protein LOC103046271 isoform X1 [Astyanax mexicanus]|uniref:uncharacterized protein LOC103046271 isoform X1 n=1 Tax=Astyanax mexicanus TaxID=7994 RepID=UPI000BBDA0DA|nr:uncharacterized protein LOC103046271 isoform X1 [Astyanax mexicanus]